MKITIKYKTEKFTEMIIIEGYNFKMMGENLLIYAIAKKIIDNAIQNTTKVIHGNESRTITLEINDGEINKFILGGGKKNESDQ